MESARAAADQAAGLDVDKLTYEIFSILESKFLFGYDDPKLFSPASAGASPSPGAAAAAAASSKVCILSIDGGGGGGRAADGLLAGAALVRLEASLRRRTGDDGARLADFFDVAAGSGAGGVLAAMLVARGADGRPRFSADDALAFLLRSLRRGSGGLGLGLGLRALFKSLRRPGGGAAAAFRGVFGDLTLRDTVRPVLVPCYDLGTAAPFLFSRADAVETRAYDFRLRDVCAATCAGDSVEARSCDGSTRIAAVGGGVALANPTAAAITHVLNNRRDFPLAAGVDDLLVVSIGSGEADQRGAASSASQIVRIAAEGVADTVDQAVAMAFGHNRTTNYIRIQGRREGRAVAPPRRRRRCWRRGTWSRCCSAGRWWRSRPTRRSWSGWRTSWSRSATGAGPAPARAPPRRRLRSSSTTGRRRRRRTRASSATPSRASCRPRADPQPAASSQRNGPNCERPGV
uniref:Patatin n=1 Tax=Zea mays TaxID=4577 RepID=A0A804M539_MAIZE